jgi:hypothetical protein
MYEKNSGILFSFDKYHQVAKKLAYPNLRLF